MTPDQEANRLRSLAANTNDGCIVVMGARGFKAVFELVEGVRIGKFGKPRPIFLFTVADPVLAPSERTSLFREILEAACCDEVFIVDLPAAMMRTWEGKISLLVIDRAYLQSLTPVMLGAWIQRLTDGGRIALMDDPLEHGDVLDLFEQYLSDGILEQPSADDGVVTLQKRGAAYWTARRKVVTWLRSKAEAAGYDGATTIGRLAYGSFASQQNRYVFIETPKAACTSWKRFIVEMEWARFDEAARPYQRETTLEMLIHQRQHIHVPTLLDLPLNALENIWDPDSDWFTFAIVRNPYSRLVSVFENKVRLGEPGYRGLEKRFGDQSGFTNAKEAFAAFVAEVASNAELRAADAHLRTQVALLMPQLIPYSRIFKIEAMDEAVSALNDRAKQGEKAIRLLNSNESAVRPWRSYYSSETAKIVADAYAEDFAQFAFDLNDWRMDGADFNESHAELVARAKIVQRNAMIDHLYEWVIDKQ